MNRDALIFQLSQASNEIEDLIQELENGEFDDSGHIALGFPFSVILNYLCNAWHYSELDNDAIKDLSQEEYERLSRLIPNILGQFSLQDIGKPDSTSS